MKNVYFKENHYNISFKTDNISIDIVLLFKWYKK